MLINLENFSPSRPRGFLVLEGVNGAGKSTLLTKLSERLAQNGKSVVCSREPGATELGKTLRSLILEPKGDKAAPIAELMLFGADRADHVAKVIQPNLQSGRWVISDRYLYSSIAFQGFGRQLPMQAVEAVNTLATSGVLPDLVILLDLDPAEGLRRTQSRSQASAKLGEGDAFEKEALAFHTRIRDGFLKIAASRPEPFLVVDASQSQQDVFSTVWRAVEALLRASAV
ncbi:MAG: dTMP kinase [Oligoflexia bacterium]|nr:dTMP kinase [Oligoflexia bacterium]